MTFYAHPCDSHSCKNYSFHDSFSSNFWVVRKIPDNCLSITITSQKPPCFYINNKVSVNLSNVPRLFPNQPVLLNNNLLILLLTIPVEFPTY